MHHADRSCHLHARFMLCVQWRCGPENNAQADIMADIMAVLKSCASMHVLQQNPTSRVDGKKYKIEIGRHSVDAHATQTDLKMASCCSTSWTLVNRSTYEERLTFICFGIFCLFSPMSFSYRIIQGCSLSKAFPPGSLRLFTRRVPRQFAPLRLGEDTTQRRI